MEPGVFSRLAQDYLLPLPPGATLRVYLELSARPGIGLPVLAGLIDSNMAYAHLLRKVDLLKPKIQAWSEEDGEAATGKFTLKILALLGKEGARNIVASIALNRVRGAGLPKKESDPLQITPKDQLKFALKAESYCSDQGWTHSEYAFLAGLHYDWLSALLDRKGGPAKGQQKYLEEVYKEGFGTGQRAYEIGTQLKKFELGAYAFSAGLLAPIGKVLMALAFPPGGGKAAWPEFQKECERYGKRKLAAAELLEPSRFGIAHSELSSAFVSFFGFLRAVEKAVCFYPEPYQLRQLDRASCQLATVLALSSHLPYMLHPSGFAITALERIWAAELGIREGALSGILRKFL